MKRILLSLILLVNLQFVAQVTVNCPSNLIYLHTSQITVYDPNQPLSAGNPSNTGIPAGGVGLTLCNNLNGSSPSPTFYTTIGGFYAWWNGSTWVTTSHSTGNSAAVNLSGAGCYIYNLVGATGQVYKYTGTGNGTLLMTEPAFSGGGPYDISSDFDGNFYLLRTTTPQWLRMYDFTGTLINTYTLNGMPSVSAGAGYAVMGNTVYVSNTNGFWTGIITGSVVNFGSPIVSSSLTAGGDLANCPTLNTGTINYGISNTGPMGCSGGTVNVMATGFPASATYSWSGPGLAGSPTNSSVPVNAPGIYNCTITPSSGCKTVLSTSVQSSGAVSISVTPTSTTICQGSSVNLTAIGAANYNWSGPALSSTTGSVVTANPMFSSSYVVAGSTGTCSSAPVTVVINVTTCTGINELNQGMFGLNVFPNPSNGEFMIHASQELELKVVNELGQTVKVVLLTAENKFESNVNDLNSGVYFITDRNGRALKDKIVVIRN